MRKLSCQKAKTITENFNYNDLKLIKKFKVNLETSNVNFQSKLFNPNSQNANYKINNGGQYMSKIKDIKPKGLGDYGHEGEMFPNATRVTNEDIEGETITIKEVKEVKKNQELQYYVILAESKKRGLISFGSGMVQKSQITDFLKDGNIFPQTVKIEKPKGKDYFMFGAI